MNVYNLPVAWGGGGGGGGRGGEGGQRGGGGGRGGEGEVGKRILDCIHVRYELNRNPRLDVQLYTA